MTKELTKSEKMFLAAVLSTHQHANELNFLKIAGNIAVKMDFAGEYIRYQRELIPIRSGNAKTDHNKAPKPKKKTKK